MEILNSFKTLSLLSSHFPEVLLFKEMQDNLVGDPPFITRYTKNDRGIDIQISLHVKYGATCVVNFNLYIKQISIYSNGALLYKSKFEDSAQYDELKSIFGSPTLWNHFSDNQSMSKFFPLTFSVPCLD